jgi:hypothetical protein
MEVTIKIANRYLPERKVVAHHIALRKSDHMPQFIDDGMTSFVEPVYQSPHFDL